MKQGNSVETVANRYKRKTQELYDTKKKPLLAKKMALYLSKRLIGLTNREIGERFRLGHSAVSKAAMDIERIMLEDKAVRKNIQGLISHFEVWPHTIHEVWPHTIHYTILCRRTEHVLRNDFTIAHNKKLYQILDKQAGEKVTVEERRSGAKYITYKGVRLKYKHIAIKPVKEKPKPKLKFRKINKPSMEHPWKKLSYDKWLLKKGHLQPQKISEELVLAEV